MKASIYILVAWNIIVMLVYAWDKLCARRGKRRIRESVLLIIALLMGSVGAIFGKVLFNHKTGKIKFRLLVPFFVLLNTALTYIVIFKF